MQKNYQLSLAGLAHQPSGLSAGLQTKGSLVRFLVRAHAWVADQVPSWGRARGNSILMFLSFSFSFPSL